ncbi:MAG: right-handed parallel beta-helix repeat-containing protein, partial [Planctomycetes bacterium]|nr:right-handed parallel beta-helix repeat-containing protein [Planctomycetota bacterium]
MSKDLQIYVNAMARGKADGSVTHPFPTLEAARDALRKLRRRGAIKTPVRVFIERGVYRLSKPLVFKPEDGGTAKCPVTWSGKGGRPLLSGARAITNWTAGTINGLPCWQALLPEVADGSWWFTQLFVNGRRRLRARFPKRGFFNFAGVPEEEAKRDPGTLFHGAMSSHFVPGEVHNFRNLADIDVVVPDHWYENHLRIASVDEASHTIHFSTKGYSRFSRDETARHTRFRLDHVAEACTDPGDWYLDRKTGCLSYIPMPTEQMATTLIEAPALDLFLSVQGDALNPKKRVQHLRFEFLDLRHADWELPRDNSGSLQSAFQVPAAVRFVGAEDCALYGCRVSQVSGWAVEVLRGCHRNRIVACALHDLGGGGVKVGHEGGLAKHWVDGNHGAFRGMDAVALGWGPCREAKGGQLAGRDAAESSATTVSDCSIHDGGLIFHSAIGVWIGDASRNRVVHNHIWNFSYSGISCGWTWGYAPAFTYDNRIEGNRIHSIGHGVLSDMGAIYTLGRQAGSTISRNYISDVHSYGYGGWGIYPDEGSSWIRIENNVVCGTKSGGFHQHYGRDNLVRRNLFVDSIEHQVQFTRYEFVRPASLEGNLVQGAGSGALLHGAGCTRARVEDNVYAGDPGRPERFADKSFDQWRATGQDRKSRIAEAILLDPVGAAPGVANPEALKAAGMNSAQVAQVVTEAGPRLRATLPSTIDAVSAEPETRRAIVEPLFWPWSAEWPTASSKNHPWSKLPGSATVVLGTPQPISLTLENRGRAIAKGMYSLRVIPAAAARI